MTTIVEYREQMRPVNDYPERIVSPPRPSACCSGNMEPLGPGRIDGLWRFTYNRCRICGYTVRHVYGVSYGALAEQWASECPDLSHWRVRLKRREAPSGQELPAPRPPRARRFNCA